MSEIFDRSQTQIGSLQIEGGCSLASTVDESRLAKKFGTLNSFSIQQSNRGVLGRQSQKVLFLRGSTDAKVSLQVWRSEREGSEVSKRLSTNPCQDYSIIC